MHFPQLVALPVAPLLARPPANLLLQAVQDPSSRLLYQIYPTTLPVSAQMQLAQLGVPMTHTSFVGPGPGGALAVHFCVCIPHNCCCGPAGEDCKWCGGPHVCAGGFLPAGGLAGRF